MGYRDEGDAALHRMQQLMQENAEQHAENQQLQDMLKRANAEIVRLQGQPIPLGPTAPIPAKNTLVLRVALGVALASLVLLAAAAYQSERLGVQAAMLAVPIWVGLIGGWTQRRASLGRLIGVAVASAFGGFLLLILFFATIWRSF